MLQAPTKRPANIQYIVTGMERRRGEEVEKEENQQKID